MTDIDRSMVGFDEVEALLSAYADARLAPKSAVLARMRAAVLTQAADGAAVDASARSKRFTFHWPRLLAPRQLTAIGLAMAFGLGSGAVVLAAPPDSPLYSVRAAIETAFLPSNPDQRLTAHEDHLTDLLAEAQQDAASGDTSALAADLQAYQAEMNAAVADVGNDSGRLAHLEDVLGKHIAVLEGLADTLPETAAIEHAILASQNALDRLTGVTTPAGPGGHGGSGTGNGVTGNGQGGGGPKATPAPHPSHPANNGGDPGSGAAAPTDVPGAAPTDPGSGGGGGH